MSIGPTKLLSVTVVAALYVLWSRRNSTVFVTKDKLISSLSNSFDICLSGEGVNKSGHANLTVIPKLTQRASRIFFHTIATFCMIFSWLVVVVGRVHFDFSPDEYAPNSLLNEWSYDLEQHSGKDRAINALFLIPDAFNLIYEFGFISKFRDLHDKEKACLCNKKDCNCK